MHSSTPSRWAAGIVVALVVLAGYVPFALNGWSELPIYVKAAGRLVAGQPIHLNTERAFAYPALFAVPFIPFVYLPESLHRPLWYAVNCAVLGLMVVLLRRWVKPMLPDVRTRRESGGFCPRWLPTSVFWVLLLLLAGRHVLAPIENQSHDLIVFLCVMLALDASYRLGGWKGEAEAGAWIALGAALKATPLLFAPILLWQRRWVAALTLLVALPLFTVIPDVVYPAKSGTSWVVSWYRAYLTKLKPGEAAHSSAWDPVGQLNQSLTGTFRRLLVQLPHTTRGPAAEQPDVSIVQLSEESARWVTLAVQVAIFGALLWVTRPSLTVGGDPQTVAWVRFGQGAAVVLGMVLLSPTSIKTHFCVLLLPFAFCLVHVLYRRRDHLTAAVLVLILVTCTLTTKGLLGRPLGNAFLVRGSVTWTAVALLGAVMVSLRRSAFPTGQGAEKPSAVGRQCGPRLVKSRVTG